MSRKRKTYSADFKAKLVLELLEGDKTLNEVASKYEVLPKSLQDWKKQFLANASLAFDKSAVVKEYKDQITELEKQKDATAKKLGEIIIERDWAVGKLKSLDLSTRKGMVDNNEGVQAKLKNPSQKSPPSLNRQLELLRVSKTAHYYEKVLPFSSVDVHLTTSVLSEAITLHGKPEIFNSDQGSQYTAKEHIETLKQHNISISMDAKGSSIDNIVIERFWRTLKYEDVYPKSYSNIKEARSGIDEYITIYNSERLHSALDYQTPDEVFYKGINNKYYNAKKTLLETA